MELRFCAIRIVLQARSLDEGCSSKHPAAISGDFSLDVRPVTRQMSVMNVGAVIVIELKYDALALWGLPPPQCR